MKYNQLNRKEFESGYEILISYLNNYSNSIVDQLNLDDSEYTLANILDEEIFKNFNLSIKSLNPKDVFKYIESLDKLRESFKPSTKITIKKELNELMEYSPYSSKEKLVVKNVADLKLSVQKNDYSFMDFLDVNPFDNLKNLNGDLTSDLFFKNLFVKTERMEYFSQEINSLVASDSYNKSFIFLTGMAGTGKTTFLNYFIDSNKQYQHDYYNCELYSTIVNFSDNNKTSTVFASIFKRKLFEIEENQIIPAFNYIISNKPFLFSFLPDIYYKFETFFVKRALIKRDDKSFLDLIFSFDDYEIAILYFLIKIYNKVATDQENITEIVYFDNLDSFPQNLLNESLLEFFPKLYVSINNIVSSSNLIFRRVDFTRKYKFIFCLREHNVSYLNSHTFDRLLSNSYNKKLSFLTSSDNLTKVIKKRINLFSKLAKAKDLERVKKINLYIDKIIDTKDIIENIQNIYNFDYRKLITFISYETNNLISYPIENASNSIIKNIITFSLSKRLIRSSILRKYNSKELNYYSTYCNVERLVLTSLINLSKNTDLYESTEVSIIDVINYFQKTHIIDKHLVFEVLSEMLNNNQYEQINFIGLNDTDFKFHNTTRDLKKIFLDFIIIKEEMCTEEQLNVLKSKYITIYPSAISYVDNFSINFEFYAALVGNKTSLYELINSKSDDIPDIIENQIQNVLKLVDEEIKYNDKIFQLFEEKNESYLYDYEIGFSFVKANSIFSHISRVILSHLSYLQGFRSFIIEESNLGNEIKEKVNIIIIKSFRDYSKLLDSKKSLNQEKVRIKDILNIVHQVNIDTPLKITTPNNVYKK